MEHRWHSQLLAFIICNLLSEYADKLEEEQSEGKPWDVLRHMAKNMAEAEDISLHEPIN